MKYLHQIGGKGINWTLSNFKRRGDLYFAGSVSANIKPLAPTNSNRALYTDREFIYDTQRTQVQGILVSGKNEHIEALIGGLNSLVGVSTTITAYMIIGERQRIEVCNCPYQCTHGFVWLQTSGAIAGTEIIYQDRENPILLIDFYYSPIWQPLDPYLWAWDAAFPDLIDQVHTNNYDDVSFVPQASDLYNYNGCCSPVWSKKTFSAVDRLDLYFPEYWEARSEVLAPIHEVFYKTGTDTATYNIYSNEDTWNAPPLSFWGFEGLPDSGQVRIDTKRKYQTFDTITDTAVLDLSEIDDELSHEGGLNSNDDLLIVGELPQGQAMIIRREAGEDARILLNTAGGVYTPTVRGIDADHAPRNYAPAMLGIGRSIIDINVPAGVDWHGYHVLRLV